MPPLSTLTEFNNYLKKFNFTIIDEYNGGTLPCIAKCLTCGYLKHFTRANNVRKYKCPNCSPKKRGKTLEEFNKSIEIFSWKVVDGYKSILDPCTFKCLICGENYSYRSARQAYYTKCPNCYGLNSPQHSLNKINSKLNETNFILEGNFKGVDYPIKIRCLNCNEITTLLYASYILKDNYKLECKKCNKLICLNCGNEFIQTSLYKRRFCYECNPLIDGKSIKYVFNDVKYKMQTIFKRYGSSCTICGYNENYAALEFHHIDSKTKEYPPSILIKSNADLNTIFKELDKCQLVCANCHRILHTKNDHTL